MNICYDPLLQLFQWETYKNNMSLSRKQKKIKELLACSDASKFIVNSTVIV